MPLLYHKFDFLSNNLNYFPRPPPPRSTSPPILFSPTPLHHFHDLSNLIPSMPHKTFSLKNFSTASHYPLTIFQKNFKISYFHFAIKKIFKT
nr:MAG TPA: hypothetical protein [Caudoviricetes sp.]